MDQNTEHTEQIIHFYQLIQDYQAELSKSADGEISHINNFGYWTDSCENLFDAEMEFFALIQSLLAPLEAGHIGLDIGCGIGGYAARLLEKYPVKLTCYDILEAHLAKTRKFAAGKGVLNRMTIIQGNSMQMDSIADESQDFAYCIESSFHYSEKQKFFNEVNRVLKPGAHFVYADLSCEDVSKISFKSGNYFSAKHELDEYIENAGMSTLEFMDIGPQVYVPLKKYKQSFDNTHLDKSSREGKVKAARYWDIVLNNYIKLYDQGLMGYLVYKIKK